MSSQARPQIVSTVAANIRAARDAKNLTQRELGVMLGVDAMYVSRWERGVVMPSPPNVEALADALGVSVAFLYSPTDRAAA